MSKVFYTKSFFMGGHDISYKITIPDDVLDHKDDIDFICLVDGKETIVYCGLDPVVEAAAVVEITKYFEDATNEFDKIDEMIVNKIVDNIQATIKKAMFDNMERRMLIQRLAMHYDYVIRHKRAQLYRDIRNGKIKPVKNNKHIEIFEKGGRN